MLRLTLLACLSLLALPVAAQQAPAPSQSATADAQKADLDSRINVSVRMASDAQAYFLKPAEFNGGANSFGGVSLTTLQYSVNDDGQHVRSFADGGATHTVTLEHEEGTVTITARSSEDDRVVTTVVTGPRVENISVSF